MIIRTCAFTTTGWEMLHKIEDGLQDHVFERKEEGCDIDRWVEESFSLKIPLLFVGAMGIAVRKIAPYVSSKLTDSPVLVMDEAGHYIIPVLSNHLGGANELASLLADAVGGQVVLTTATDVRKTFAVDLFAKKNGCKIVGKDGIKEVSAKVLRGERIRLAVHPQLEVEQTKLPASIDLVSHDAPQVDVFIDLPVEAALSDTVPIMPSPKLYLIFKPYIIGVGCRKETDPKKLDSFISGVLMEQGIDESLVAGMASIDLKKREKGLLYFEAVHRIPFTTYSAQELKDVKGTFHESAFVKEITGVSNVCERAAMKLAGEGAQMVLPKYVGDGMTLAVSRRKARIDAWEI